MITLEALARDEDQACALTLGALLFSMAKRVSEIGFPIEVDGAFGQQTFTAVKDFQRGFAFWALLVDGHAGEKTHGARSGRTGGVLPGRLQRGPPA